METDSVDNLTKEQQECLERLLSWVEQLVSSEDLEKQKIMILFEILEGLVKVKHSMKARPNTSKVVKKLLKKMFMKVEVLEKMRCLLLMREKDRSFRESCIRALKKILKISKKIAPLMKSLKIHFIMSFMIEREFKQANLARERTQSLKFIVAWMNVSPECFPLVFGQTLVSIAKN